ncbi:tyrosine-type recombinase/integrase [Candidatus Bathyarchaeota archaeon]|nr:tyrosine-type recombinase/integrase [Candidatus Bathyarchaeota archaeon]
MEDLLANPQRCPECGSDRLYKGGLRYLANGRSVQRWLCRNCGYRFSKTDRKKPDELQHAQTIERQALNSPATLSLNRQGSREALSGAPTSRHGHGLVQTLAAVETRQENPAREGTATDQAANISKILEYAWWLKKKGRSEETTTSRVRRLKALAKHCNLMDPEAVKEALAKLPQKNSTKAITASVYTDFLKCFGLSWEAPEYKIEESIPFIPLEREIDELIASCNKRIATLLQVLKETGARIGEVAKLRWIDFDPERRTLRIHPEKGSNPRILPISEKLAGMLNNLPKNSEYIFNPNTKALRAAFNIQRRKAAIKLNNPRLQKITFHTLRHWKGTMEYHKTKDPWHVKKVLGHKSLQSTEVYINIEQAIFEVTNDEYHVRVAHDLKEACALLEAGFEYVTDMEGVKIFRKRK